MELTAAGLFRAKWSEQIHDEWIRNVLKNREDLTFEQLNRTKELMNSAVPDSVVEGYGDLVPALSLRDADDRHILAAAIVSSSDAIVTFNLSDFPKKAASKYGIEVLHPDDFIFHQFGLNNAGVIIAAQRCRARLKNPPKTAVEYLETLERQGLPKTVAELREYHFAI